ncbi:MAG: radical SAM protein, partial [Acidobacteria bacterium]|nr:radical SAM protein [Acidobacteriota bacterium]
LPTVPVMLGCARPLGPVKERIDRLAIDSGFNGISYPAEGVVEYARKQNLQPRFINACCGVTW